MSEDNDNTENKTQSEETDNSNKPIYAGAEDIENDSQTDKASASQASTITKPTPETNILAIASLVSSFFISLLGLILGIIALRQIKQNGQAGKGLAIAGIVISLVSMIIMTVAVLAFVLLVANSRPILDSQQSSDSNQTVEQVDAELVPLETFAKVGDISVRALSVERQAGRENQKPQPGNIYLSVDLEVINEGFETSYLSNSLVTIKDSDNNRYQYSFLALPANSPTITGEIASKETIRGRVGFEIPRNASGLTLSFASPDYSGESATIDLGR